MVDDAQQLLQENHFDEQEREPDAGEAGKNASGAAGRLVAAPQDRERREHQQAAGEQGLDERGEEHRITRLEQGHPATLTRPPRLDERWPAEEVPEERPVVGRWTDVEDVAGDIPLAFSTQQRPGAVMEPGLAQLVVDVRQRARHTGEPRDVERPGLAESSRASDFIRSDRAVLCEQGNGLPAPDHEQPARRIGDPGSLQRGDHGGEQFEAVPRRHLHMTRDGKVTAGIQSRQVELECLHRVNVVFVEAAEAAGGTAGER